MNHRHLHIGRFIRSKNLKKKKTRPSGELYVIEKKTLLRRRREIRYCFRERILLASACNDWSRRQCSRPSITAVAVSWYTNKSFRRSYYIYRHTRRKPVSVTWSTVYGTSYYYIYITYMDFGPRAKFAKIHHREISFDRVTRVRERRKKNLNNSKPVSRR